MRSSNPLASCGRAGSVVAGLLLLAAPSAAQQGSGTADAVVTPSSSRPATRAGTKVGEIRVDGRIDESAWRSAPVTSGFVQREPDEGMPAGRDTEVRVLFDDDAMYVAAHMWEHPDSITKVLVRRDERGSFMDWFGISIDPNLDRRTGYQFKISAGGSQQDLYISDDTREDMAWNTVWESAVSSDSLGWHLEVRIPLSQIRYESTNEPQTWGLNFVRRRAIVVERSSFALDSRRINGTVSQYGTLEGVRVPGRVRRVEARPYVLSSLHNGPTATDDPFFDGNDVGARIGSDFRVGLGSSFTLDAAINPDFGQVDADPAVINLSAFETRFQERRPFFVEDAQVFDFGLSGGQNELYYSRRIGRAPHGDGPSDAVFTDAPDAATIVGAAKLTGRTGSGLSLGGLVAVTQAESGRAFFDTDSSLQEFRAEPRTEYSVVSARQDFRDGQSQVGLIATALHRDLPSDGTFENLPDQAYSAGVRFDHQWGDRGWKLAGFLAGSHVMGSPEAMVSLQRSSVHYFQRPDGTRARVDSTATSLSGAEWRLQLDRQNTDHWTGSIWTAGVTKGFDVNDLGFSTTRERIDGGARLGYRELRPGRILRDYNLRLNTVYNFSWEALAAAGGWNSWRRAYTNGNFSFNANATFLGYRRANLNLSFRPDTYSRSATRGGPVMIEPGGLNACVGFSTDNRQPTSVRASFDYSFASRGSGDDFSLSANVTLRPSPNVRINLEPEFSVRREAAQYVTSTSAVAYEPTFGRRYLFGDLQRKSFGFEVRADYTLSPALSFQLYAQPLLSSGDYTAYKQLARPSSFDFVSLTQGTAAGVNGIVTCTGGSICRDAAGDQHVDFDGDGAADYQFGDRDFNVRSLVGNAVLRWEYRPGSVIFLVWQRQQEDEVGIGDFDLSRDLRALWVSPAHNRFIVKVNYWLGL